MNSSFRSILAAGACASLLMLGAWQSRDAAAASPPADPGHAPDAQVEPGQLRIRATAAKAAAADDIAGDMRTASGALSFQTTSLSAGKAAAVGATPERVRVRLEVNGALIDHEIDYAAGTMTVRTIERVVIDEADRAVLRSFQNELGRALSAQGDMQRMPKSKDFLWRLAEMYSEVPLGRKFAPEWIVRRSDGPRIDASAPPAPSAPRLPFARDTGKGLEIAARAACNDQGGGSFINLRSIANVCDDDVAFTRSSSHDYCPTHGYTAKSVRYGCSASSCAGRCGAGCGVADGVGAWYQDCLDHDVCNRDHNSQLGACGDEFNEAADDYAFGTISCYTTCG